MNEKEIKKYNLLYHTNYEVEVVATSLEEAQKIAAENIKESSKYECSQDLWNSLKYKSHTVSEASKYEIEEYFDEYEE